MSSKLISTEPPQLYLASASPRRKELLDQLGVSYRVLAQDVDESRLSNSEIPEALVSRLAKLKAESALASLADNDLTPVLGADTIVLCDGEVLGKPEDFNQAVEMLSSLSGRSHHVLTAVILASHHQAEVILCRSEVWFRKITIAEIQAYWSTGEPKDKAGAYAIQGLGALFVERLEGSYSAVVGLPIFETVSLLEKFGLDPETIMQGVS